MVKLVRAGLVSILCLSDRSRKKFFTVSIIPEKKVEVSYFRMNPQMMDIAYMAIHPVFFLSKMGLSQK
jgi:hypothetical protein